MVRTRICQACHHHKLVAHQGVVHTLGLVKRQFYWPNMQEDVEAWCQRCAVCTRCKAAVHGHRYLQQPTYGAQWTLWLESQWTLWALLKGIRWQ